MSMFSWEILLLIIQVFVIKKRALGSPVYDVDSPYWEENFDPSEADPIANITCLGGPTDLRLPMLGDFDPNTVSMQRLCAKPQYGGGGPGQHAGAFCFAPPSSLLTGEVAFDFSSGAQASTVLQNRRLMLTCYYRCFCNYGLVDASVQPKSNHPFFKTWQRPSISTYELQVDIENDFIVPPEQKMGRRGLLRVDSLQLVAWTQVAQPLQATINEKHQIVSLDPDNEIECRGNLPTFNLPSPYRTSDFANLQHLCAMQLSGGNENANAGGYCHRSDTDTGPLKTVWFSDDMTPRLEWTWDGGNFFASASIRYYCWQRCACKTNHSKNGTSTALWNFIRGHELTSRKDGSMFIQPSGDNHNNSPDQGRGSTTSSTQVLPPQKGAGSPSGTCGVNGNEFCSQKWDVSTYGPVPVTPPNVTDIIKPSPPNMNLTVCGNECTKPSDCSTSSFPATDDVDAAVGCSCALPSVDDARTLGFDPVAPVAVCMALFISSIQRQKIAGGTPSSLGGRDVQMQFVNAENVPHTCRCNETVIADACCVSSSQTLEFN